jgi:type IV pilus assembly protein PilB
MAVSFSGSLGSMLVEAGLINAEQLAHARDEHESSGDDLGEALVRLGYLTEVDLYSFLARQVGMDFIRDVESQLHEEVLGCIPGELAMRYRVLPLQQTDRTLTVALADPLNLMAIDDLRLLTGFEIKAVAAAPSEVDEAIEHFYMERMFKDISALKTDQIILEEEGEIADLEKMAREALVIKLVNLLIHQAIQERASDIHIEPHEKQLKVRFRIDGQLHDAASPPKSLHPAIVSRIKILAELDIAERRLPQDGRTKVRVGDQQVDLRISTLPTLYGESVVIRLLVRSAGVMALHELGMSNQSLAHFDRLITRPHGIILVTGPTGSGKTTTLYGALNKIYSPTKKIITIEDPVEYELVGANQIEVRTRIGLTFARGLRHIVRQDPDIIMVGEIRDAETADIAINAALTGHLVFSTFHTNDAPGALTRLLEMGIEPYLIASSIIGVLAQRLVGVICHNCKRQIQPLWEALRELEFAREDAPQAVWRGTGCEACRQTGYHGRTGVFELLAISDSIKDLVLNKASASTIKQRGAQEGMQTLLADGREKVRAGITSIEEVLRVCQRDEV